MRIDKDCVTNLDEKEQILIVMRKMKIQEVRIIEYRCNYILNDAIYSFDG